MKKIVLFLCLSIGAQQTYAMQSLKNAFSASRSLLSAGALLAGSLYVQKKALDNKNSDSSYTVNLMWINKNPQPDQQYVFPSKWRRESDFDVKNFNTVFQWASLNPNAPINIWFDSNYVPAQAITNSNALIQDHVEKEKGISYEYSFKIDTNIGLKDIRELPHVQDHPVAFSDLKPVYLRADLLRVIATSHTLAISKEPYFVYADLDVYPLSPSELFDERTQSNLNEYGIVMTFGGFEGPENSFHIISNRKPNLIKVMNEQWINQNIKNIEKNERLHPESVYDSQHSVWEAYSKLEGEEKIIIPTKKIYRGPRNGLYD